MTDSERKYSDDSLTEPEEVLDENMTMYYLNNLQECKVNVARGLKILYELAETQDQIYQALTLRCRSSLAVNNKDYNSADQTFLRVHEDCQKEQRAIQKERTLLQNFLKIENRRIIVLEGCIFSLPEPQRSIVIARYIDRQAWSSIQKRFERSASSVFALNKEGIKNLLDAVRLLNSLSQSDVEKKEKETFAREPSCRAVNLRSAASLLKS